VTWLVVLLTWIIAYCFLEDLTVVDTCDPEEEEDDCIDSVSNNGIDVSPTKPMVRLHILRRWFPKYDRLMHHEEDETHHSRDETTAACRAPNYKMYRTQYTRRSAGGRTSPCAGVMLIFNQVLVPLQLRSTWRVLVFGFATSAIAMNWTFSEMILPPFLERRFGEYVPIYTIQSINLFGCLIFPPLVGAFTSGREDFSVIMPGRYCCFPCPYNNSPCETVPNAYYIMFAQFYHTYRTVDHGIITYLRGNVPKCNWILRMASIHDNRRSVMVTATVILDCIVGS
jgi:hypothetical protein